MFFLNFSHVIHISISLVGIRLSSVHEDEALTCIHIVFFRLGEKKKLLPPAGANKTAGTMYGKIEKEKNPRSRAGTLVVKVNV